MNIRVLGAFGGEGMSQRPSAFLVNERTLVDAGTVPGAASVADQLRIEHAIVSHAHLDHVAGLAFLTETLACAGGARPVTAVGVAPVVDALRSSVFNSVVWPDFARIPPGGPVLQYRTLSEGVEERVGDLLVRAIPVSHSVPTTGFIIQDGGSSVVYSGDTGPTAALWRAAAEQRGLGAIILECAFPSRMEALAAVAGHMTPARIERELRKLPPHVPIWIFHIKPQFYEETAEELSHIGGGRLHLVEQDKLYTL
jgi:ribonuclease BN (tRNA processing enzyme)